MRYILVILCLSLTGIANAQLYRVFFSDKSGDIKTGDLYDIPVQADYINSIRMHCDSVWMTSNWLNYALIEYKEYPVDLLQYSFVKKIEEVIPLQSASLALNEESACSHDRDSIDPTSMDEHRQWQIDTLGYQYFKDQKINGSEIVIAIIDAGFTYANESSAFKDIFTSNRVLKTYDFIDNDTNVFHGATHGTSVWSCIAGNLNDKPTGLAGGASFILLRSEDQKTETMADEDRWIQAIEKAYEWGADIVNSSVGFTNVLHSRDQLNGQTLISQAADIAAKKGMLVVVSAGNEWITLWKTLSVPADADGVIAVGGIDMEGNHSYFSSVGPTADGRAKPDVVAPGTCVIVKGNDFVLGNGTSFATPLVTGYLACMLELKGKKNFTKDSLKYYAGLFPYFDYVFGFGVPNVISRDSSPCDFYGLDKETKTLYHQYAPNEEEIFFFDVFLKIVDSTGVIKFSKKFTKLKRGIFKIKTTTKKILFNYHYYYDPQPSDRWCIWWNGCYSEF